MYTHRRNSAFEHSQNIQTSAMQHKNVAAVQTKRSVVLLRRLGMTIRFTRDWLMITINPSHGHATIIVTTACIYDGYGAGCVWGLCCSVGQLVGSQMLDASPAFSPRALRLKNCVNVVSVEGDRPPRRLSPPSGGMMSSGGRFPRWKEGTCNTTPHNGVHYETQFHRHTTQRPTTSTIGV